MCKLSFVAHSAARHCESKVKPLRQKSLKYMCPAATGDRDLASSTHVRESVRQAEANAKTGIARASQEDSCSRDAHSEKTPSRGWQTSGKRGISASFASTAGLAVLGHELPRLAKPCTTSADDASAPQSAGSPPPGKVRAKRQRLWAKG